MSGGGGHKVVGDLVEQSEVPRGSLRSRRIKLCDTQLRIGNPRLQPSGIGIEAAEGRINRVVNRRVAQQRRLGAVLMEIAVWRWR